MLCGQKNAAAWGCRDAAAAALHLAQQRKRANIANCRSIWPGSVCSRGAGGDVHHILLCRWPPGLAVAFSTLALCKGFPCLFPDGEHDVFGLERGSIAVEESQPENRFVRLPERHNPPKR